MTLTTWYWLFYALALISGAYGNYRVPGQWWGWGGWLVTAVLFLIIGLTVFGSPIKGH